MLFLGKDQQLKIFIFICDNPYQNIEDTSPIFSHMFFFLKSIMLYFSLVKTFIRKRTYLFKKVSNLNNYIF